MCCYFEVLKYQLRELLLDLPQLDTQYRQIFLKIFGKVWRNVFPKIYGSMFSGHRTDAVKFNVNPKKTGNKTGPQPEILIKFIAKYTGVARSQATTA